MIPSIGAIAQHTRKFLCSTLVGLATAVPLPFLGQKTISQATPSFQELSYQNVTQSDTTNSRSPNTESSSGYTSTSNQNTNQFSLPAHNGVALATLEQLVDPRSQKIQVHALADLVLKTQDSLQYNTKVIEIAGSHLDKISKQLSNITNKLDDIEKTLDNQCEKLMNLETKVDTNSSLIKHTGEVLNANIKLVDKKVTHSLNIGKKLLTITRLAVITDLGMTTLSKIVLHKQIANLELQISQNISQQRQMLMMEQYANKIALLRSENPFLTFKHDLQRAMKFPIKAKKIIPPHYMVLYEVGQLDSLKSQYMNMLNQRQELVFRYNNQKFTLLIPFNKILESFDKSLYYVELQVSPVQISEFNRLLLINK